MVLLLLISNPEEMYLSAVSLETLAVHKPTFTKRCSCKVFGLILVFVFPCVPHRKITRSLLVLGTYLVNICCFIIRVLRML